MTVEFAENIYHRKNGVWYPNSKIKANGVFNPFFSVYKNGIWYRKNLELNHISSILWRNDYGSYSQISDTWRSASITNVVALTYSNVGIERDTDHNTLFGFTPNTVATQDVRLYHALTSEQLYISQGEIIPSEYTDGDADPNYTQNINHSLYLFFELPAYIIHAKHAEIQFTKTANTALYNAPFLSLNTADIIPTNFLNQTYLDYLSATDFMTHLNSFTLNDAAGNYIINLDNYINDFKSSNYILIRVGKTDNWGAVSPVDEFFQFQTPKIIIY